MTTTPDYAGLIAEAITDYWGDRCSDYDADCPTCQAWKQFDEYRTLLESNAALEQYAREATIAITGLTVGGSEYFGKRIGEVYTADLPYCVEHIRERMGYRMEQLKAEAERARLKEMLAEADRVIEPFAEAAGAMDNLHGPHLSDTTRVRPGIYMGELRAARAFRDKAHPSPKGQSHD